MKKWLVLLVVLIAAFQGWQQSRQGASISSADAEAPVSAPSSEVSTAGDAGRLAQAFKNQQSNVQVQAGGVVSRVLADDRDGSAHQRFIVRLASGQTVLIAHNIDLAPRVANLREGDAIEFLGEYEWNAQGGVVHWTHRDPDGSHVSGWLRHDGRTYQ
ncbi:MAG: DUF3465 domain-containing protein [Steroidobacteraceae bacterium]